MAESSSPLSSASIKIVDDQPCVVKFEIQVPAAAVSDTREKVFVDIQRSAQLPGFRAGKAPLDRVKSSYAKAAHEQVIERLVGAAVREAFQRNKITPVDEPVVDKLSLDENGPLSFTLSTERHPEVKLRDYTKIRLTRTVHPVTDATVQERLNGLRERNARLIESTDKTAGPASIVLADYECSVDGLPVPGARGKNELMDLARVFLVEGFTQGLHGAVIGEARVVKVPFPADHAYRLLAGKTAEFTVTITAIKDKSLPALDDAFAKDLGAADIAGLTATVRSSMEKEETDRQRDDLEHQILDHLLKKNEFPVPSSLVEAQTQVLLQRLTDYLRRQHAPEQVVTKRMEEARADARVEAEKNIRVSYLLEAVADIAAVTISDDELAAERAELIKANPGRDAEVGSYFDEHKRSIAARMRERRIFDYLIAQAQVSEKTEPMPAAAKA